MSLSPYRMAESVIGENPLHALAEVSEELFASGVNWGRIVVFFYFTYEVARQSASSFFGNVMDWAMNFLRDRLALWIEQQGGWPLRDSTCRPSIGKDISVLDVNNGTIGIKVDLTWENIQ
ncbi:hypothetical protein Chor_009318 [Crotalus horridus]